MDAWIVWLIVAVVFAVGEILTTSFFLGPFAIGATAAALVSLAGAGDAISVAVFAVLTAASFAIVRPIARRHLRQPAQVRTGTAALIGQSVQVLERIANDEGTGLVKLEGEVWTARAYDEDRVFEQGDRVAVVEIRGATALVAE
ncbi:MAG: NfeD family protein [Solirubrobacteraceae bacterium]|jgi:membrane protein implicated in regulation of membrane protease activity|nr:NfeD family protein [Solirubrobacteraceae bacterium]